MVIYIVEVLQTEPIMKSLATLTSNWRREDPAYTSHYTGCELNDQAGVRGEWPGHEERRPVAALWHRGQLPIPGHCEHPDPGEQMSPHHHQCRIVTILIPGTNVITNNLMTRSQITRTINPERVEQMMRPGSEWMRSLFHHNSCLGALKWVKFTRVSSSPLTLHPSLIFNFN